MKKLLTALVIIVSMGTAGSVCAQDFQNGVRAYQSGDYATALREFKALAEQGNAGAQSTIAGMYALGRGVPDDNARAYTCFAIAAAQGDARAKLSKSVVAGRMTPAQIAEAQRLSSELWEKYVLPFQEK
mgnify:CR=1 FL=1